MNITSSDDQTFLKRLTAIVEANFDNEQFGVNELAVAMKISRSQIHRKLKSINNQSISQFIREVRLKKSKELLGQNEFTVSEIAYKVGFGSPSYFIKCFHDFFGYPPGEYVGNKAEKIIVPDTNNLGKSDIQNNVLPFKKKYFYFSGILLIIILIAFSSQYFVKIKLFSLEKSLAVLPVKNLTGVDSNDYIVDGLQDAIIGELGRINSIRVISRTSTQRYRESDKPLKEIANELGVNTIMESTVTGFGDSLRIIIQVIDVFPKERHVLAKEYYDDMKNVLSLQSAVVKDIARSVNVKLTNDEIQYLGSSRTVNPESYKAYLRGMYYLSKDEPDLYDKGISYLREAIDKDPADPFAYAALAIGFANEGHSDMGAENAFDNAMFCANRAIELDSAILEAYTAKALLYLYQSWEWDKAREAFDEALKRNPNDDIAHAHFAWYYVLYYDWEKAIYHAREAIILNPLNIAFKSWLALIYYHNKDYDKSEALAKEALSVNENANYANISLGWVNLVRKNYQKAIDYHEKLPKSDYCNLYLASAYVKAGEREKALPYWEELEERAKTKDVKEWKRGFMAAILGYKEEAFKYLSIAIEKKQYPTCHLYYSPLTESITDDPRYNELMKKLNLPPVSFNEK